MTADDNEMVPASGLLQVSSAPYRLEAKRAGGRFEELAMQPSPAEAWELFRARRVALRGCLAVLSQRLNHLHGVDQNTRYWDIILGLGLRTTIFAVQANTRKIDLLSGSTAGPPRLLPMPGTSPRVVPPSDTRDVVLRTLTDHETNHQLLAHLLTDRAERAGSAAKQTSAPRHLTVEPVPTILAELAHQRRGLRRSLRSVAEKCTDHLSDGRVAQYKCGWETLDWLRISRMGFPQVVPGASTRHEMSDVCVAHHKREALADPISARSELERVTLRSLRDLLPVSTVEAFAELREAAEARLRRGRPVAILGAPADDVHRHWAALAAEGGSKIIHRQHGGLYGESIPEPREDYERAISDRFVTWGWRSVDAEPLPVGLLHKRRRQFEEAAETPSPLELGRTIIWVTQEAPFAEVLSPFEPFRHYQERQQSFARELERAAISSKVTLRLRKPKASAAADVGYGWAEDFDLAINAGLVAIMTLAHHADLLLVDRAYSTTFLECLAVDQPVVVWAPGTIAYARPGLRPHFERLHRVGVLLEGFASDAAAAIASIEGRANDWWCEPERQRAIADTRECLADYGQGGPRAWSDTSRVLGTAEAQDDLGSS